MSDTTDTIQCTNCKLEILSNNYTIHYVHCQRNFYLCSLCMQPVNYNNRVEHDKTSHVVVHCHNCHLGLEQYLLEDHLKNECPHRGVKCQICDIEVKATDIAEHENYCGSRTEKCMECGEFVMLKYKTLHIDSNHGFIKLSDEPTDLPSPSWQYGRRTLCNFMPDLSSKSYKPASIGKRKFSENARSRNSSESGQARDDSDEINRKNLNSSLHDKEDDQVQSKLNDVFDHKEVRKTNRRAVDEWPALCSLRSLQITEDDENISRPEAGSSRRQNELDEESDLMYAIQVSQEINSDIWRKEVCAQNEALKNCFKPYVDSESSSEKFVEKNMFDKDPKKVNKEPKVDLLKNDFSYMYDKHESVKLPCEFCGTLIVSNDLFLHQSRCSLFRVESFNGESERRNGLYVDDDMEKKIACGICNKFFKLPLLENHLLNCQRYPSKSSKTQDKTNYSKNLKVMNFGYDGLEPSSPQLTRVGTPSEWLSESSKSNKGNKDATNKLNNSESAVVARTTKVSRKNRRAPSPPTR